MLRNTEFQILLEPKLGRARLASTLTAPMPSVQDPAHAQDKERRNRQQFDSARS
jgi:hypothetical protein